MNEEQAVLNKLLVQSFPPTTPNDSCWRRLRNRWYRLILLDENHVERFYYFKSDVEVMLEKRRHYGKFPYTIHPLSKLNQMYEVWSCVFYLLLIFMKTADFAWILISTETMFAKEGDTFSTLLCVTILDIMSFVQIWFQFFIGYRVYSSGVIELSLKKIAKRYICSGHFFCDLLSSIPRAFFYNASDTAYMIITILTLLKMRRLSTVGRLVKPTFAKLKIQTTTLAIMITVCIGAALAMHCMTCLDEGAVRMAFNALPLQERQNKILFQRRYRYLPPTNITRRYLKVFFLNSQLTLLVNTQEQDKHYEPMFTAEIVFRILNYFLGKILLLTLWSILLHTILSRQSLRTKFQEIITELDVYMTSKNIPEDLKKRINDFYRFKYQNRFYNDSRITSTLSRNLMKEVDTFLCRSFINQVDILSQLPISVIANIVGHLEAELYLPSDIVIQSGTSGETVYFIESGTVAVCSPSGKEVCHLQDGAYFGEISLVRRNTRRTASVIAVEFTKVYKLKKRIFFRCFRDREDLYREIIDKANRRAEQTVAVEERFKKELFHKEMSENL